MDWSMLPLEALRVNEANARLHPRKQIEALAKSISEFKYFNPIVIDEYNLIIAGEGRYRAGEMLRLREVPVIRISGLSPARKRALALADNKLPEGAAWNRKQLALEIPELSTQLQAEGLDIEVTGFTAPEIDQIVIDLEDNSGDPADELTNQWLSERPVSRIGDFWQLGDHTILCGDARNPSDLSRLMDGRVADMMFTDPPYNVQVRSIGGRGRIRHPEFAMASGEMSVTEYRAFLKSTLGAAVEVSRPGALHFIFEDWRHIADLIEVGTTVYAEMLNLVVWTKSTPGQGSFYRSQHELVGVFRIAGHRHLNNVELGKHGRTRSNVWHYPGANTFRKGRLDDLKAHPTIKPVAMVCDALRDCTRRGDAVLDPFLGSGTTILAAERVGRHGYGLEIEPRYVDVAIRRWQAFTGRDALHVGSGAIFDELVKARSEPEPPVRGDDRTEGAR